MDETVVSENNLTEEDLINDYLIHTIEKLDQKVIDARKNAEINGVKIPFYLELEKEIRLIFIYEEANLKHLNFHAENIRKIKELKKKDVKIVLLIDDISQLDINKVPRLCEYTVINIDSTHEGSNINQLSVCKRLEIHEYQGWILKDFEGE